MPRKGSRTSNEYSALHGRVNRARGKPKKCVSCGTTDPNVRYEWATVHGLSGEDPEDYIRLCKRCHALYDHCTPDEELLYQLRQRVLDGETKRSIARSIGISRTTLQRWLSGKRGSKPRA